MFSERKYKIWWDEDEEIGRAQTFVILDELIVARSTRLLVLAQQIWSSGGFIVIGLFWLVVTLARGKQ